MIVMPEYSKSEGMPSMFCTHIFFNGNCRQAIDRYAAALDAKVLTVIACPDPGKENLVLHAEMEIHGQKLMLNDFGGAEENAETGGYQLVVQFADRARLESAFGALAPGGKIISPLQPADYSPCVVRFADSYGTRWAFYV